VEIEILEKNLRDSFFPKFAISKKNGTIRVVSESMVSSRISLSHSCVLKIIWIVHNPMIIEDTKNFGSMIMVGFYLDTILTTKGLAVM
jgi:hypothetical protein